MWNCAKFIVCCGMCALFSWPPCSKKVNHTIAATSNYKGVNKNRAHIPQCIEYLCLRFFSTPKWCLAVFLTWTVLNLLIAKINEIYAVVKWKYWHVILQNYNNVMELWQVPGRDMITWHVVTRADHCKVAMKNLRRFWGMTWYRIFYGQEPVSVIHYTRSGSGIQHPTPN